PEERTPRAAPGRGPDAPASPCSDARQSRSCRVLAGDHRRKRVGQVLALSRLLLIWQGEPLPGRDGLMDPVVRCRMPAVTAWHPNLQTAASGPACLLMIPI